MVFQQDLPRCDAIQRGPPRLALDLGASIPSKKMEMGHNPHHRRSLVPSLSIDPHGHQTTQGNP